MKSAAMIIAAMVLLMFTPGTLASVNDFRSRDYTEPHIITTAATDEADVTLSQALFSSATANVLLTSNNTADAPIPHSYVAATKVLTVSGLAENDTRNLSVVYRIDALDDYFGVGIAILILPALLILGIIGLIAGAVYTATRRED